MRRSAARTAGLFAVLIGGCGPGVGGLSEGVAEPLFTVVGRIEGAPPADAGDLRVGLVWARPTLPSPFCQRYGPDDGPITILPTSSVALAGCRDPGAFVRGPLGPSVPLAADDTSFRLPLTTLPAPEALLGTSPQARFGYATVVIFEDVDGDGALGIAPGCFVEAPPATDRVLAASFTTFSEPSTLLSYSEVAPSAVGATGLGACAFDRPGLAILHTEPAFGTPACERSPLGEGLTLTYGDPQALAAPTCPVDDGGRGQPPPLDEPFADRDDLLWECVPGNALAIGAPDCACPGVILYELEGAIEMDGEVEVWSFTSSPPEWWPCEVEP